MLGFGAKAKPPAPKPTQVFCCKGDSGDGGFDLSKLNNFLNKNPTYEVAGCTILPTTSINLLIVMVHQTT